MLAAMRFGFPAMVSDVYYQLQNCTGSEVMGNKTKHNYGLLFTFIMFFTAITMMVCMLDSGKGIQFLAFIGCGGLMFVGAAPNYLDADAYPIHKIGALVAAAGCVGWCMSACWVPTAVIALIYLLLVSCSDDDGECNPSLYMAEVAGFLDVYITYWTCAL